MEGLVIRVSPRFAQKLKNKHLWFNDNIAKQYFNKEISFVAFTSLITDSIDTNINSMFQKAMIFPNRKGRKRITFDFDTIPI